MTDISPPVPASSRPSRRTVLRGSAVAVGAAGALRAFDVAAATAPAHRGMFGYGVASGDPTGDAVVIWTRVTPPPRRKGDPVATPGSGLGKSVAVVWEVSLDDAFHRVVRRGVVDTAAASDHSVKVDVTGLAPYTGYWFRFRAAGETSPVGRTQTAPDEPGATHALRFALVSCSNYNGGYFTTYRALGERTDLDFVLHVGDYIYEYGNGADRYGPAELAGERDQLPAGETIELTDYRLRHAAHKADPDLQLAHAQHPFISIFDDHEVANNAWATGAENHTPGAEGDFAARRRAAYQAYLEWMPFRLPEQETVPHQGTRFFKRFTFGALADLSVLETRQNRSRQVDLAPFTTTGGGFIPTGLVPPVDAALADPSRHLPEPEQLQWLEAGAELTTGWHLVGNQVILAPIRFPGDILGAPGLTLLNSDQWDGYQADQAGLLASLAGRPQGAGDVVVLTGDIHSSWAMDLPAQLPAPGAAVFAGTPYESVGVEFVCPSVTSDGFYEIVKGTIDPDGVLSPEVIAAQTDVVAGFLGGFNAWVKYLDGIGHGYLLIDVTPERVQADFFHTPRPSTALPDPRTDRSVEPAYAASWQTLAGSRRVSPATEPIGPRVDEPTRDRAPPAWPAGLPRSRAPCDLHALGADPGLPPRPPRPAQPQGLSARPATPYGVGVARTLREPACDVGVVLETDVLEVGSGPAGLSDALAAARAGAEVSLRPGRTWPTSTSPPSRPSSHARVSACTSPPGSMSRTLGRLRPPRARRHRGADGGSERQMPKYLLGVTFEPGPDPTPMEEWSEAEVTAHLDYYRRLNQALVASGELVDTTILVGPDRTKIVRGDGAGAPVVTDGPFQEFKEWLAGYQIIEVADEARALEIAALVSAVPGKDGVPTQQPIHVRQVMDDGPADAAEMDDYLSTAQGS